MLSISSSIPSHLFLTCSFLTLGEVMDKMMGETSLHIWDIHVDESHQRKGLGKHLLTLMELIARR
jgi:ribosomal protein S18 acetylase RimI-like enzyme